ncbi:pro-resilin isoform X2 [Toxorhynchites rutilus septentrionalis]|uniref:pro-resilin isoform X2 n=1 Tax=Toxorhynchites rutilus septentrionalis TaxID=329112 RepID=UPI00247AAB07|nr:pro-resilin isoform X2 [Toxorhynchites rutilus septentrionalis]
MAATFRKLVTWALLVGSLVLQQGSCASLAEENTVGGGDQSSVSSSKLAIPTLGGLYRNTRDEYGRLGREPRCGGCGASAGGNADRDMRSYGRPGGIYGYYSGRGSIYDDRNWYYRPDGYSDDRASNRGGGDGYYMRPSYMNMMMGYDDRYMNRYDDRHYPMSMRGSYDSRGPGDRMGGGYYGSPDMGMRGGVYGYRGNGYDNLDPNYEQYMMMSRGGYGPSGNRDRHYGTSGGYGAGYDDRHRGSYGGYDNKNFRPWDETYSRPPSSPSPSAPGQYPPSQQSPSAPSSSSSHYHHHQSKPSDGTYTSQPIGFHHSSGPDRPDYSGGSGDRRPCCPDCCSASSSSRYPSGPTGTGAGYNQPHNTHQQQQQHPHHGERPDHDRPGEWSYLSGAGGSGTSGHDYHQQGSQASGSSSSHSQSGHDYGNRGGYNGHKPEGGDRQQNTAYGSRPRPGGLGATSYLMDRDTGNSVSGGGGTISELHSSDFNDINGGTVGQGSSSSNDNDEGASSSAGATAAHEGKSLGESSLKNNDS